MASWPALRAEVQAQTRSFGEVVEVFLPRVSATGLGRAARLLAEHPEIAEYSLETAVVLGDAERVRRELSSDPGLVSRSVIRGRGGRCCTQCARRAGIWIRVAPRACTPLRACLLDAGADVNGLSCRRAVGAVGVCGDGRERRAEK